MKLINWISGLFQDQNGSTSSKRLVLYIFTYFFYLQVQGSISGSKIDPQTLYATLVVILFLIGAVTSEFFKNMTPKI
jgi:hypothetical protein